VKIFVSHSHQNSSAAKALVDYLLSSLQLEDRDIRCTSVPGHQLRFGKTISELLKSDINVAPALIALISRESLSSDWVMFELGAAWGLDRDIFPILGPGLHVKDLPGPLSNLPCIVIEEPTASSRMSDLIQQIAEDLNLSTKNGGKVQANLDDFLNEYASSKDATSIGGKPGVSPENQEESVLLTIWRKDESAYDEHGYSLEAIAEQSQISNPKCDYILNSLIKNDFVERKQWVGGVNGVRYMLKNLGRDYLLKKSLVD
jgi:hypothetical protein